MLQRPLAAAPLRRRAPPLLPRPPVLAPGRGYFVFAAAGLGIAPPAGGAKGLPSCTRCAIGCGVHGFAMNPCDSTHPATAPYYREARVTFAWRQTACRMRHCCARRIEECSGRRKLLRTPARWAERHPQGVCRIRKAAEPPTAVQQRMIGTEANRIAMLNAASPRAGSCIPEASK